MAYGFDVDRLLVWLAPRDPDGGDPMRAGSLCKRHADAMVVPRGWTLDDRRDTRPRLFRTAPAPTEPAPPARRTRTRKPPAEAPPPGEQLELDPAADVAVQAEVVEAAEVVDVVEVAPDEAPTVAEVTGAPLADDDPDATVAIPWLPTFDDGDDLDGMLAPRSPLLARAFRGTDRPR